MFMFVMRNSLTFLQKHPTFVPESIPVTFLGLWKHKVATLAKTSRNMTNGSNAKKTTRKEKQIEATTEAAKKTGKTSKGTSKYFFRCFLLIIYHRCKRFENSTTRFVLYSLTFAYPLEPTESVEPVDVEEHSQSDGNDDDVVGK